MDRTRGTCARARRRGCSEVPRRSYIRLRLLPAKLAFATDDIQARADDHRYADHSQGIRNVRENQLTEYRSRDDLKVLRRCQRRGGGKAQCPPKPSNGLGLIRSRLQPDKPSICLPASLPQAGQNLIPEIPPARAIPVPKPRVKSMPAARPDEVSLQCIRLESSRTRSRLPPQVGAARHLRQLQNLVG